MPVFRADFFFVVFEGIFFYHPGHHPADHPGIILVCSLLAAFECTFMKGFICGRRQLCVVGFYEHHPGVILPM